MPSKKQWEQLRVLDKLATKANKGGFRERYLKGEIDKLRREMGLPPVGPSGPEPDAAAEEHGPDSLPADPDLFTDL